MNKKIGFLILFGSFLILFLNYLLLSSYDNYVYQNYAQIMGTVLEKYPDLEGEISEIILNNPVNENIIQKYGISNKTVKEISSYKPIRQKVFIITSSFYILIITTTYLIYYYYISKNKHELKVINNYLNDILKGEFNLNIADYNDDELSVLKNDIYKVTIKLKELSEYEKKEQIYLMNTLEDISHQLKTPLTALMVTNDILKNPQLTKKERLDFLNKETKELEKMEWLITTLLKYSKIDSGSVKFKKEKVKPQELIRNILDTLSIALELKNIDIELDNLDFTLICDKNWTKEALTNIIKNAVEHLEFAGKISITGENNPLYQALIITDNGPGIKKEDIKNIFKRFYTTNHTKNSVGIGLNMAKLIIERQKGKIEVESEVGKYTTFKVMFMKKDNY